MRTFTNGPIVEIPSNGISGGTGGVADPYPSKVKVSDFEKVTEVNVTIRFAGHTDPDDLDVPLVGPSGQTEILWSDAGGGNDITGVRVTLDDEGGVPSR